MSGQHPFRRVRQGGDRIGHAKQGVLVDAQQAVSGHGAASAARQAVAATGTGEHQCIWVGIRWELAGDGLGDRAGEGDDADAGRALGSVLVAGAEAAGVVADLQHLKLPAA